VDPARGGSFRIRGGERSDVPRIAEVVEQHVGVLGVTHGADKIPLLAAGARLWLSSPPRNCATVDAAPLQYRFASAPRGRRAVRGVGRAGSGPGRRVGGAPRAPAPAGRSGRDLDPRSLRGRGRHRAPDRRCPSCPPSRAPARGLVHDPLGARAAPGPARGGRGLLRASTSPGSPAGSDALRPTIVLVETELWPNLLHGPRPGGPVVVERAQPERMSRYQRRSRSVRSRGPSRGSAPRTGGRRFLGSAPRPPGHGHWNEVRRAPALALGPADCAPLRSRGAPVLVAGSTGEGEEGAVLDALLAVRGAPALVLVLAPATPSARRSPARRVGRGLALQRLSAGDARGKQDGCSWIRWASCGGSTSSRPAFVGGSLVDVGGHNLLEPAARRSGPVRTAHGARRAGARAGGGGGRCVADAGRWRGPGSRSCPTRRGRGRWERQRARS
jgi:hypothetical protein